MCGIAGFVGWRASRDRLSDVADAMGAAIAHRGPDDRGTWIDPHHGVGLAHRRLSVIDLSPLGRQPMHRGPWTIVFNGEIYNFVELRRELVLRGAELASHSDTEVILAAVEAWGVEGALERLNGMFAFALWDGAGVLYLARDRLGEKPLYYGALDGGVVFGSELRALRQHPAFRTTLDPVALEHYLRFGYVSGPRSIFADAQRLPAGTVVEVQVRERCRIGAPRAYWSLLAVARRGLDRPFADDEHDAVDALDRVMGDAVKLRMRADVPVGALLSGGIDSSLVVATMTTHASRPVETFTVARPGQDDDEGEHARAVAGFLGTKHHELRVDADAALRVVPRLAEIYDEPFADSSQIPSVLIAELVRKSVTVCLTGDGGDESFGGYDRYGWCKDRWSKVARVPPAVRSALGAAFALAGGPARLDLARTRLPGIARKLTAMRPDDLYADHMAHWVVPPLAAPPPSRPRLELPSLESLDLQMMALDSTMYLPDDILVKVDRASMAVALEMRLPLLDHRVIELAWSLPVGLRRGKRVLRSLLERRVPRSLWDRPKVGFRVPIGDWLRGPLRPWAEELLSPSALARSGLLDVAPIRCRWELHLGGADHAAAIWIVLMLQSWLATLR